MKRKNKNTKLVACLTITGFFALHGLIGLDMKDLNNPYIIESQAAQAYVPPTGVTLTSTWTSGSTTCNLYSDGIFVVSGNVTGAAMANYSFATDQPWYSSSSKVKKIIIEGTNEIGRNAFLKFNNVTDVVISTGVTSINQYAFEGLKSIKNVEISDKVTSINGFKGCSGITELNIPESVTTIWGFNDCTGLTKLTIPKNVKAIYGFDGCSGLTELSFPSSVTGIYGFDGCSGLTELSFPNSVTSITGFGSCTGLTKVTLPDNLVTLGGFSDCPELTNIVIPSGVLTIDNNAFKGCTKLTNFVIPNKVTVIKSNAFSDCPELTEIIIPNSVTGIAPGAFNNTGLTSIDIPSSVVSLGGFAGTGLTELTIPNTVKTLYIDGFANCTGLKTLNFNATLTTDLTAKPFINTMLETVNIGPDVTSIPSYMFSNQTDLKSFTIPDNVTSIGAKAFQGSGIEAIEIPESIKTIGDNAFTDSANLKSVVLSANLTSATNILSNTGITDIEISDNVTTLPDNIFSEMDNLKKLEIPSSIDSMKANTFANCTGLTEIIFNNKFSKSNLSTCINLSKIYMLGGIDGTITKAMLPTSAIIYGEKDSSAEAWCTTNGYAFKALSDDEIEEIINGKLPSIQADDKFFDFLNPIDLKFKVNLGVKPAGATGINRILVDNNTLSPSDYSFNGTDTVTIKASALKTLHNGIHYVSVLFNNGTFKSGATIYVMGSNVPVVDPNKPPEALDTVKYEFYKDYPDYVIIPVSLNGATQVTKLKVGTEIVDEAYYELDEGAIIIDYDYLRTLDAGKYRVLPTFNDPAITTLNNIQLYVYENAADRAAPYLLQTRILFKGQNFKLKFDSGLGSLEALNVLALVIDDQMFLQNGTILPFNKTNIAKVMKTLIDDIPNASPSEAIRNTEAVEKDKTASPSEAIAASPSEATMSIMGYLVDIFQSPVPMTNDLSSEAFYVVNNEVYVNGSFIAAMNLEEGDHLIGAIFDNTEKTTDIKKVILSIPSDGGNDNDNGNNGNNENGNNGNAGDPGDDSGGSDKGNNSGSGNGGNSGNGGSGSGGGKNPGGNESSGGPGTTGENSKDKPKVPDDGGTWIVNPNDPTDVTYKDKDGNPAPNKWIGDGGYWRHTNSESKVDYGWFKDTDGTWYLLNKEPGENFGAAKSSWHYENQDGMWYYLSTKNAAMLKGWNQIDGKWYYFTEVNDGQTYYGNNITGWFFDPTKFIKPLGSMWADERTPDEYLVDKNGVWIN